MGNWIWIPSWNVVDGQEARIVCFRREFALEKKPGSYRVRLSADTRYKLYVNGEFIEAGPIKGDIGRWYYDEIELAPHLHKGRNVLAVQVLRYPTAHGAGNFSMFRTETPGLYIDCMEPEGVGLCAANTWRCKRTAVSIVPENPFFAPLQIYEEAQGVYKDVGWMCAGFDDTDWEPGAEISISSLAESLREEHLIPRPIPFLQRERKNFKCVSRVVSSVHKKETWERFLTERQKIEIPAHTAEIVELDVGELMTGYLSLGLVEGAGARLSLLQSECYAGELQPNSDPFKIMPLKGDRADAQNGKLYGYTDRYHVAGAGNLECPEVYEPFWFRTFRYIRFVIETAEQPLVLLQLDYEEVGYPLEIKSKVEVSDLSMKSVWDICARSLKRCMHETYEDCPFYE